MATNVVPPCYNNAITKGQLMSLMVNLKSACGKSSELIDWYDANLNPDGSICCDNCKSIIASRQSWYNAYSL